jgi:hypothetical protein
VFYPLSNIRGIDIEPIAVLIARVTLWMGHRQMIDRYGDAEPVLPLVNLSGIKAADALRTEWPEVDAIIGNPPFLGSQLLRASLGADYLKWLDSRFGVGIKDLCVYWFRKAQDELKPGQRAGLVGTNSISQNRARDASLEYVVDHGGIITEAVSTQRWPGDAKVHVSIVNWVKEPKEPPTEFVLDGEQVNGITSSLRSGDFGDWSAAVLAANRNHSFQGPIPVGTGFVLDATEARKLVAEDAANTEVVRPYLVGDDIANDPGQRPTRWIIDFGTRPLESVRSYARPLGIVRDRVKPERDTNKDPGFRTKWWLFGRARGEMRVAIAPLRRYIAGTATGKRLFVAWFEPRVCPSNLTNVFAFDDDYSMGILMSRAHDAWAWAQSSTLKGDLRYTPTTVFATFPWPDPLTDAAREQVAAASSALYARRSELCIEHNLGLTKLYNLMDDGAFTDLAALHRALDTAVAAAYGWPASVAQDPTELVRRLTELNREIVQDGRTYNPFPTPAP